MCRNEVLPLSQEGQNALWPREFRQFEHATNGDALILHQAVGATSKRVFRGISRAMWTPRGHSIVRSWPDRIDRQAGTENVRPACLKCDPRSSQLDADLTAVAAFSISAATACGCETYTA